MQLKRIVFSTNPANYLKQLKNWEHLKTQNQSQEPQNALQKALVLQNLYTIHRKNEFSTEKFWMEAENIFNCTTFHLPLELEYVIVAHLLIERFISQTN